MRSLRRGSTSTIRASVPSSPVTSPSSRTRSPTMTPIRPSWRALAAVTWRSSVSRAAFRFALAPFAPAAGASSSAPPCYIKPKSEPGLAAVKTKPGLAGGVEEELNDAAALKWVREDWMQMELERQCCAYEQFAARRVFADGAAAALGGEQVADLVDA